jgi:RimJ/RimL family protein N-acetyltransferase
MNQVIEFSTTRLRLRQWQDRDRDPFAALNADRRVMEFFPAIMDRRASDALVDRWQAQIAQRGWGLWAVERIDSGEFIGFTGLQVPLRELPFGPCVEVGWRLAAAHWRHGYASEGARAVLKLAFATLDLAEVVSFTALNNLRSRAVMQRIGLNDSGIVFDHPGLPPDNSLRAHCLYRLTRAQWRAQQSGPQTDRPDIDAN